MIIPSFQSTWKDGKPGKPRIYALEVHHPGKPGEPPDRLLIEREESYRLDEMDKAVCEGKIEFFIAIPQAKHERGMCLRCSFCASYHANALEGPTVKLTSHSLHSGAVFLDPPSLRGHRVGTYLMNEIVLWSQQWPSATVASVNLIEGQAYDENRARRNRFYEQFGLVFDYKDASGREGVSRAMPVSALTPVDTWKESLRVHNLAEFLGDLLAERDDLAWKFDNSQTAVRELLDERRRVESRPVRWMLRALWAKQVETLTLTAVAVAFALLAWWRWPGPI